MAARKPTFTHIGSKPTHSGGSRPTFTLSSGDVDTHIVAASQHLRMCTVAGSKPTFTLSSGDFDTHSGDFDTHSDNFDTVKVATVCQSRQPAFTLMQC